MIIGMRAWMAATKGCSSRCLEPRQIPAQHRQLVMRVLVGVPMAGEVLAAREHAL